MQPRSSPPAQAPTRRAQRHAQQSGRAARHAREQAATRQRRVVTIAASIIVVLIVGLVAVRLITSGNSGAGTPNQPAPDALVAQVTGIDPGLLDQVGRGTLQQLPSPIRADVEKGPNGLPVVTYVGAEYCPFCAGERWPLIMALGRFGTFSGLELSHSATDDVYPNTATFSFVSASYSSSYVDFSPVELQTNVRSGSGYEQLQTPTPAQTTLLQKYDAAPYVAAQQAGSIPFIDFGGQYAVAGASFDVGVLRGMTQEQIAGALTDPSTPQSKAILGSANALTAAICSATQNAPSTVCGDPVVQAIQASLAATPVPGKG
jgi:hypothetical protein